jgi:hypothetical protein
MCHFIQEYFIHADMNVLYLEMTGFESTIVLHDMLMCVLGFAQCILETARKIL